MKKRVLIFSLAYYPYVGGAEVALKEITDRMSPDEFEFHMVTNRYDSALPSVERMGNVLVHRIGITTKSPDMADLGKFPLHLNKLLYQFLAYRTAVRLHKKYVYSGLWAMMAHATGVPAARFKKRFPDVTYILTLQEGDPPEQIERTMWPLWPYFKRSFAVADVLQPISNFLGDWGRRMGYRGSVEVIPNAVDTKLFSRVPDEPAMERVRRKLGKKDGDVFLVTTSRLVHKNAIDDVIRALSLLPAHVHFLVCGSGPEERALKALAQKEGVAKRTHFVGHVERLDIPAYLHACDIFIRPSRSEGMGNSFIEAMAAGLPVIATQEGGIADFLFDARRNPDKQPTGWAVEKNDPKNIAETVGYMLAHQDEVDKIADHAKTLVIAKYDWDDVAKAMEERVFSAVS